MRNGLFLPVQRKMADDPLLQHDLTALNKLDPASFNAIAEEIVTFIVHQERSSDDLLSVMRSIAEDISVSVPALKSIVRNTLSFLREASKRCMSSTALQKSLLSCGLEDEKASLLTFQWKANFVAICRSAMTNTFMVNKLVDMEWKFGVSASSSDSHQLGCSFLQLKLVVMKSDDQTECVHMELTLPQFYAFLHEMEKAKQSLDVQS